MLELNRVKIKRALMLIFGVLSSINSVAQDGKTYLVERTFPDMFPMSFLDESSQPTGFETELLAEIQNRIDIEVKFSTSFANSMENVKNNTTDMMMSAVSITDARKPYYDFSIPYFIASPVAILSKEGNLESLADLVDKNVAVLKNSTHEKIVREVKEGKAENDSIITVDTSFLAFKALAQGKADAAIGDDAYMLGYITRYADLGFKANVDTSFPKDKYGIAFAKGNTELKNKIDNIIKELIADGTYDRILHKWYPDVNFSLN